MIAAHVEQLSLAIDALARKAEGPQDLAARIRRDFPDEPLRALRRAIFYAVTDPGRSDGDTMLRLQGAAMALNEIGASRRVLDRPGP